LHSDIKQRGGIAQNKVADYSQASKRGFAQGK